MTRCGWRNEAGWYQPCAKKPERAGQELYLDPVYIFQGTEGEKKLKFLVFNYRAAMAKGTLSMVVLSPTA